MKDNETCKTCEYWDGLPDDEGFCLRYPPARNQHQDNCLYAWDWPITHCSDWCGEYVQNPLASWEEQP